MQERPPAALGALERASLQPDGQQARGSRTCSMRGHPFSPVGDAGGPKCSAGLLPARPPGPAGILATRRAMREASAGILSARRVVRWRAKLSQIPRVLRAQALSGPPRPALPPKGPPWVALNFAANPASGSDDRESRAVSLSSASFGGGGPGELETGEGRGARVLCVGILSLSPARRVLPNAYKLPTPTGRHWPAGRPLFAPQPFPLRPPPCCSAAPEHAWVTWVGPTRERLAPRTRPCGAGARPTEREAGIAKASPQARVRKRLSLLSRLAPAPCAWAASKPVRPAPHFLVSLGLCKGLRHLDGLVEPRMSLRSAELLAQGERRDALFLT